MTGLARSKARMLSGEVSDTQRTCVMTETAQQEIGQHHLGIPM